MPPAMSSEGPFGALPPLPPGLHKPLATLQQSMRLMLRSHEEHRLQNILQLVSRVHGLTSTLYGLHVPCIICGMPITPRAVRPPRC
jgi:hypothetical protein